MYPHQTKLHSIMSPSQRMRLASLTRAIAAVLSLALVFFGYVGLLAWHVYTAWVVYALKGTFWGVVVFFTPPFSDLVCAGGTISAGGVMNWYIGSAAVFLACYIAGKVIAVLVAE